MATPNIVPRADSEGGLGTASKYWASAYIDTILTTGSIGIGATPSAFNADADDLVVGAGSGNTGITIHSGTSGFGSIFFADGTADDATEKRGQIRYLQGTERMDFHTDGVATAALSLAASGAATFAANIALGGGAFNTTHSNVTSIVNLDDNASIFTRSDLTNIGQNIYYNSSDAGAAIEDGRSTLVSLGKGTFSIHNSSASVSADAATSLQERFSIDTAGAATFAGDVAVGPKSNATIQVSETSGATVKMIAGSVGRIGTYTDDDLKIVTDGQDRVSISNTGVATFAGTVTGTSFNGIPFYSGPEGNSMYTHDVSATDNEAQYNAAYGFLAMDAISTGDANVAIGYKAGSAIAEGSANVAVGYEALMTEDGHGNNTAIGYRALRVQDAGADAHNTAIGFDAGVAVSTGIRNTLIGGLSGDNIDTGSYNVTLGMQSLSGATGVSKNTAIGTGALELFAGSGDTHNTAVGYTAGQLLSTGVENTLIGSLAGDGISLGSNNVALGYATLSAANAGSKSVAIGSGALAVQQTSFGIALCRPTSGSAVVTLASGNGRISDSLIGTVVTGTGVAGGTVTIIARSGNTEFTMSANATSGDGSATQTFTFTGGVDSNNAAVGYNAGNDVTTGIDNTLIGAYAGDALTTGSENIAIGSLALSTEDTGAKNIAIGNSALEVFNYNGHGNCTVIGYHAGKALTGRYNTVLGTEALSAEVAGVSNVAIGFESLKVSNGGTNNTAVGTQAGLALQDGGNNTIIGGNAGDALTTGSNNIIIGNAAAASAVNVNNEITLGDANISAFRCADQSIAALSDGRDKTDVKNSSYGLEFINTIRPVEFTWNFRPENMAEAKQGKKRVGFIAQELQEAMPNSENEILDLVYNVSDERIEAKYGNLIPILVKAIQELSEEVKALKNK